MAEQQYPWIFYHPRDGSRIFESEDELQAAGPGWTLTPPAAGETPAPAPMPEPPPSDDEPPPIRSRR